MKILDLKARESCRYDLISLGEVMLRFDPGEGRVRNARRFTVWEGGGEYNVARGLRKCFRMSTAAVTALAENDIGRLVEDFIMQGGVDVSLIKWTPYDGIGRSIRNGLNFTERGFGLRGALGISDRGHTAASKLKKGDIDWEKIFSTLGVRWFHTGGIYAALSETTPEVIEEAMVAAKNNGTIVSYDLNYRPSLWQAIGGQESAIQVNRSLAPHIDVILGNEEDFTLALGFEVENLDNKLSSLDVCNFKKMIHKVVNDYPNFKVVATTLRTVKTANINDWGAICWAAGNFYEGRGYKNLEIFDRVGGGDSFASGLIYGLMKNGDPLEAVNYGIAHGALAMTTPGDTSMASLVEVEKILAGCSARVLR
jgi:2-dehydro-3-deoxygluconokinase